MRFTRRTLISASPLLVVKPTRTQAGDRLPFDYVNLQSLAAELASVAHRPPHSDLPIQLQELSYDQYKDIRFRPERTIALGEFGFSMQTFHPGFLFKHAVKLNLINSNGVNSIPYSADLFDFGQNPAPKVNSDVGFAGFKLIYPLNSPHKLDEVISFLGASYFRFLGKEQRYGASARGLAVGSGDPNEAEEFPFFKEFWLVEPIVPRQIRILALLDSISGAGAFEFTIHMADETLVEVRATLYARTEWRRLGIAPLTSMF